MHPEFLMEGKATAPDSLGQKQDGTSPQEQGTKTSCALVSGPNRRESGEDWGQDDISDPEKEIRKYRSELSNPPYFGALVSRNSALVKYLQRELAGDDD